MVVDLLVSIIDVSSLFFHLLNPRFFPDKASGGSMDWVRHARGTPLVYTYELRGRYFHWPAARISEQGDEVTQMMLGLATEARNLGYY